MDYVKRPIRAVTAPAAQRAYLSTVLFLGASFALLVVAALAYPVFYYSYVPKKVVTLPVHLQYNAGLNPYGLVSVSKGLMLETAYDVSVELTLPRSPANTERGNFMVALFATKSALANPAQSWTVPPDPYDHLGADNVVFSARRPALVPYEDPLVSYASRVLFLLYHVAVAESERVRLAVPMGELVEFRDQLPLSLLLDVQAGQTLQVYDARITLVARLTGARWFMYNHRLLSFAACTTLFWLAEMLSMGSAWLVLSFCFGRTRAAPRDRGAVGAQKQQQQALEGGREDAPAGTRPGIKREDSRSESQSTLVGGEPRIKREDTDDDTDRKMQEEESVERRPSDAPRRSSYADADDEDGEGTATSYGSGKGLRRRWSQKSS